MDWPPAIERNRDALKRIVTALFALASLTSPVCGRGGPEGRRGEFSLPRHLYAAILLILRPADPPSGGSSSSSPRAEIRGQFT